MTRVSLLSLALVIPGTSIMAVQIALAQEGSPRRSQSAEGGEPLPTPSGQTRLGAPAQGPPLKEIRQVHVVAGPGGGVGHTMALSWLGSALEGKTVKGAPFSATAISEIEQPLVDGNRIRQKTGTALARDSAGRTRREVALGAVGPLVAGTNPERLIHIHDPGSEASITLDPARRTAFKIPKGKAVTMTALPPAPASRIEQGHRQHIEEDVLQWRGDGLPKAGPGMFGLAGPSALAFKLVDGLPPDAPEPVREDLGTQTIEGVKADGQRTTVTIPAGKIGNERPLITMSERWFSPELGVVVMSRHSDPRFGTSTYRLTSIDRREPPAAQFEVPSDYKMEEGPVIIRKITGSGDPVIIRKPIRADNPQE